MASNLADAPPVNDAILPPARSDLPPKSGVAALSPIVAGAIALLLYHFVPDRQALPASVRATLGAWPCLVVLIALLTASLLMAVMAWLLRSSRAWVLHYAPLLAGLIGILAFWNLTTQKLDWMPLPYFPGPDPVFAGMIEDRAILFDSAWHSLLLLLSGFALGVLAGIVSGVLIGWFPQVRYWGMPLLKFVGPLPATALIPLVMMLSDESFIPAAALIGYATWFPVTMLTSSGISGVRLAYLDVARTLGAGRWYLIFHVALPAALPSIFIGLFMGLTASFLTLTVAEAVGVKSGLGWYMKLQQGSMVYAKMYAVLILMAGFFSLLMTLLFRARDRMLRWQQGVIKW